MLWRGLYARVFFRLVTLFFHYFASFPAHLTWSFAAVLNYFPMHPAIPLLLELLKIDSEIAALRTSAFAKTTRS